MGQVRQIVQHLPAIEGDQYGRWPKQMGWQVSGQYLLIEKLQMSVVRGQQRLPACSECWAPEHGGAVPRAASYLLRIMDPLMTKLSLQPKNTLHYVCKSIFSFSAVLSMEYDTYLSVPRVDFRTCASLSDKRNAIIGNDFDGSHAPMPDFFNIADISSSVPCRVLATLAFSPWSSKSWKTLL